MLNRTPSLPTGNASGRHFLYIISALLTLAYWPLPALAADVPAMVRVSCNEVSEIVHTMPRVGPRSGLAPRQVNGTVTDPLTGTQTPGCTVTAEGAATDPAAPKPHERVRQMMTSRGWREDTRYTLEEGAGSRFAVTRRTVVCIISAGQEEDRYRFRADCAPRPPS